MTVQVDDTTVGSTPDDSAPLSVTVTDANDAPVLDNSGAPALTQIFENQANSTGTLVSDLVTGLITDQDLDPDGIAITSVDDSNGTWQYSTNGGSTWSDIGAVSDGSARLLTATASDLVRFVPNVAFNGTVSFDFRAWDGTTGSSGATADASSVGDDTAFSSASETATINVTPIDIKLFFSTIDDQVSSGTPAVDSWARGDIIAIGDPGFALEADGAKDDSAETSGGTLYDLTQGFLNTANTASSDTVGDVRLSGMHYVGQDVTVGSTSTFNLLTGDLLLSVAHDSATFDGSEVGDLTVGKGDVFVFRPDVAGNFSSGSFFLLLKDPAGGGNLTGIALTETVVTMGSTTLASGTLIYATDNAAENNISFYRPDQVGATTTALSSGTLINGDTIGLGVSGPTGNAITGLSLIKQAIVVDGVSLSQGSLLVALDKDDGTVGNSGATAAGQKNDIYALDVSATEVDGGSLAEATLLFDGSDIGLNTSGEGFSAFTVLIDTSGGTQDPSLVLDAGSPGFTEDGPATLISPLTTVNDPDSADVAGGQLRVEIIANGTVNDRLSLQDQGAVTLVGDLVKHSGITVGTLTGGTNGVPLVITFNSSASDVIVQAVARAVSYDNLSGDPSELTRTVQFQLTDGDGGTSAQRTQGVTVTAVNDNPVITSGASFSVAENLAAVTTITATDPENDVPTFHITGGDDAALFAIDSVTGALNFKDAPDFEGPADADANNSYRVEVTARDGNGNSDSLLITVSVTDVNETPVAADWYNPDWGQRKAVTIDAAQVAGSLTDFPVLVSITDTDLRDDAQADGDDILFTSTDGTTKLAHEIESYNGATGELRVWVKTDLSAGEDTVLYLYYGNGDPLLVSQQDPTNVWDSNFVGVWHLDEAPDGNAGTDEILDSTVNAQHGNTEGAIDATDLVAAKIGEGVDFDSVDASLIRIDDSAVLDSTAAAGTFELWIQYDNSADGDYQIVMSSSNRYSGDNGYEWASQGDGDHYFYPKGDPGDGNYNLGADPFTNGQWHHLAVTFDYDQLDASIFIDGVGLNYLVENVPAEWSVLADPADWLWGGNPESPSRYIDATMDEIRVSNTDRSSAWIQTSYANQWDAAGFASLGGEESRVLTVAEDAANDTTVGFVGGYDDDGDALTYAISGGNTSNAFKINAVTGEIQVNDANAIDFETLNSYTLTVSVADPEGEVDTATVLIDVTDINEAPSVSLTNPTNTIAENTDTTSAIKVADIVISDDALGTNTLSLTGADAGSFEIVGTELRLKAGQVLDYESQVSYDVSVQVDDSGVGATPDDTALHPFAVTNVNEAPVFSNSGGTVAFTEGGAAVVLDIDHTILDPELSAIDNFDGATLTLVRNGGAHADDVFSASGTLGALTEGGSLVVGATTIGTVTTSSAGTLVLTFNASATNALVNQAMQQIAYSNSSDVPLASVQIDWSFDDGNTGAQGSGGALTATDSTTVNITAVNDAPVGVDDPGAFSDQVLAENPVGYWRLGEPSGPTATNLGTLGAGADGTYNGPPTLGVGGYPGSSDTAATFNGTTDYVDVGNFDVSGTGLTLSAWFNANNLGVDVDHRIISKCASSGQQIDDHSWMLSTEDIAGENYLRFRLEAGGTTSTLLASTVDLSTNHWYFATATYDAATGSMKIFLDGVEIASRSHAVGGAVDTDPTRPVWIGANPNGAAYFDGQIDEVAIYDKALTATQIQAMFDTASGGYSATEDTALVVPAANGVLANDIDPENDSLTAVLVSGPANASSFTLNADGSFDYTGNANFTGTDTFTYRADDGTDQSGTTTVTINVGAVNDAPIVSVSNATPTFTENGGAVGLFSGTSIDPVEVGDLVDTVHLRVESLSDGSDEVLVVDGQAIELTHLNSETTLANGYDVDVSISGTTANVLITRSGGYSAGAAETLVDGLAYNNTSENPQGAVRLVTLVSVKDDGGTANGGDDTGASAVASLVTIVSVNDAPVNQFTPQPSTVASSNIDGVTDIYAADLNGDGDIDLVSSSYGDDRIVWYENDGASNLTAIDVATGVLGAREVFVADVNNDGHLDILTAAYEQQSVVWYENDGAVGTPTFTAHTIALGEGQVSTVYAVDLDKDGDTDVLAGYQDTDEVVWYENDGLTFTRHVIASNTNGVKSVVAGDLDSDGDIDVASVSYVDDKVAWFENDGAVDPAFTQHVVASTVLGPISMQIADVDGDGNQDLVVAAFFDGKIAWYQNDGSLTVPAFSENIVSTSATGARDVTVADLDGDGDADIIAAAFDENEFSWYESDGGVTLSFVERTIAMEAGGPRAVAVADMDGDSDLDVVGGAYSDDEVGFFENTDGQMGIQVTAEDTPLTFNAANNNLVWILDRDAGALEMKVRLEVANGTVSLNGTTGLTLDIGTGSSDAVVEVRGSLTDINTALDGMVFTPTGDFAGIASVRILTDDQGNSGSGGALTDDDTINITVTPVNDAPLAVADTDGILEDAVDVSGNVLTNDTLGDGTAADNTATLNDPAVGSYGTIALGSNGAYTYTLDNANPAVQQLAPAETLTETYNYTLTDKDGDTSSATLTITITGTDDLPVAVADTDGILEDAVSTSGNVLSNDTLGDGTAAGQHLDAG